MVTQETHVLVYILILTDLLHLLLSHGPGNDKLLKGKRQAAHTGYPTQHSQWSPRVVWDRGASQDSRLPKLRPGKSQANRVVGHFIDNNDIRLHRQKAFNDSQTGLFHTCK